LIAAYFFEPKLNVPAVTARDGRTVFWLMQNGFKSISKLFWNCCFSFIAYRQWSKNADNNCPGEKKCVFFAVAHEAGLYTASPVRELTRISRN